MVAIGEKAKRIISGVRRKKNKESEKETITKTPPTQPKKNYNSAIALVLILVAFVAFFYIMKITYDETAAMEECRNIQEDEGLAYDCVCFPATQEEVENIDIYDQLMGKIQPNVCRCDCDIGNNETWTALIPRANPSY